MTVLRIAAFGFCSFPPRPGSTGADKFAMELLPRLTKRDHQVIAYNRIYPGAEDDLAKTLNGVEIRSFLSPHADRRRCPN